MRMMSSGLIMTFIINILHQRERYICQFLDRR
jgi:hypothetical protein